MRSPRQRDHGALANGAGPERQSRSEDRRPPAGADCNGAGPAGSERFLDAFESFTQAIRRARGASAQFTPGQLTFSQYALLRALDGRDAARVSDLAGDAEITPSTATRILDALERRSIVSRARSPEDRRGVTVTLTEQGREALARQDAWMRGRQQAFFEQLPTGERELASGLLVRMAALIDELSAGPTG